MKANCKICDKTVEIAHMIPVMGLDEETDFQEVEALCFNCFSFYFAFVRKGEYQIKYLSKVINAYFMLQN